MEPQNIRFGGGSADTVLHPFVLVAILTAIALIFLVPRKYVVIPLLLNGFLVPLGQVVVVGGIHFTVYRILVISGLARVVMTRRSSEKSSLSGGFCSIDCVFTLWALLSLATFSLQWMRVEALVKSVGSLLDALGGYFVLRFLIHDREDVRRVINLFVMIAVVVGACMLNEQINRRNIFALLGGIPSLPAVREGQLRSQGPFAVYITAGAFGATLLPLFIWLWRSGGSRAVACAGMISSTVIALTSHSSTPLLAYAAGIVGLCFWPLRGRMRAFRWALVVILVGLHLVMEAPVWALIARIDLTGSSSGFHRYMLVDNFVRHFGDWWLLGVKDYDAWGFDMWDLSNQYVECGLTGGLVTLIFFIAIISRSFGKLGMARKRVAGDRDHEWFLWCLCAGLLAHAVAYFGISYFDQMQMAWYALLAIICTAVSEAVPPPNMQAQEVLVSTDEVAAAGNWALLEKDH